jgi:recombinational DNA repair protein (RecF pathway)
VQNKTSAPYVAFNVFVPALLLEVGLLLANRTCPDTLAQGNNAMGGEDMNGMAATATATASAAFVCQHTGLHFLTSAYPEVRRLLFYSLVAMVLQLWQTALHQVRDIFDVLYLNHLSRP